MENFKKVLWWLIGGSRGGKNKTIQHHLRKLEDAKIARSLTVFSLALLMYAITSSPLFKHSSE
jgi:hypothetical protein